MNQCFQIFEVDTQKKDFWVILALFLNFFRNLHTFFHSGCTNLHSYQQYMRVPLAPHPLQHLFLILLIVTVTGVRCYFILTLICISLINNNIKHHFIYLLAVSMCSLEKCLFRTFLSNFGGFFFFFLFLFNFFFIVI